jgi:predicted RNase H-like HicB family nuclease
MSMSDAGFGSTVALNLTRVTYRQLDYWARTGLVGSSIRQAAGRGSRRVYSFEDLVALRVVARLLKAGVSLQGVRRAVEYLKQHADQPLSTLCLIGQGNRVFALMGSSSKMIEATAEGQVVIAIDVEPIEKDLRTDVTELSAPREIDVCRRGSTYRAILTPDLEAGGYTVEVPELPGCITEGDTLAEAKRMARDAIQAWLDATAAHSAQRRAHSR